MMSFISEVDSFSPWNSCLILLFPRNSKSENSFSIYLLIISWHTTWNLAWSSFYSFSCQIWPTSSVFDWNIRSVYHRNTMQFRQRLGALCNRTLCCWNIRTGQLYHWFLAGYVFLTRYVFFFIHDVLQQNCTLSLEELWRKQRWLSLSLWLEGMRGQTLMHFLLGFYSLSYHIFKLKELFINVSPTFLFSLRVGWFQIPCHGWYHDQHWFLHWLRHSSWYRLFYQKLEMVDESSRCFCFPLPALPLVSVYKY